MSDVSLIGAWRLRSFVFTDDAGGTYFPLGETPQGSVLITPDGHLSLVFMAADRTPFAENNALGGTPAEQSAAASSFVSFGGPCRVEGDEVVVTVEHAFHPNWLGSVQRRAFVHEGDQLTLRTTDPITIEGRDLMGQAKLVRAGT